jgi:hypothetical protein
MSNCEVANLPVLVSALLPFVRIPMNAVSNWFQLSEGPFFILVFFAQELEQHQVREVLRCA